MPVFNAPPGSSDTDDLSFEGKATQMEIREMMCEEEFAAATRETPSPAGRGDGTMGVMDSGNAGRGDEVVPGDNVVPGNDLHPTFTIFRDDDDALPSVPRPTRQKATPLPLALHRIDEEDLHHDHRHRASQASQTSQATATGTATFTPHTHTRPKPQSPTKHTLDRTQVQVQAQVQTPVPDPSPAPHPSPAAVADRPAGIPRRPPQNEPEPENANENDENLLPSDCASLLMQLEHLATTRRALLARVQRVEAEEKKVLAALSTATAIQALDQRPGMGMDGMRGVNGRDLEGDADGDVAVDVDMEKKDTTTRALPVCGSTTPSTTPACTPPTHASHSSRSSLSARRSCIPVSVLNASSPAVPAHQPSFTAPTFTSERRRRQRYTLTDESSPEGGVGGSRGKYHFASAGQSATKSVKASTASKTATATATAATAGLPLKVGRGRGRAAQLEKGGGVGVSVYQTRSASVSRSQTTLPRDKASRREKRIGSAKAGGRSTRPAVPGRATQTQTETQTSTTAEQLEYTVPRTVARKEWAF